MTILRTAQQRALIPQRKDLVWFAYLRQERSDDLHRNLGRHGIGGSLDLVHPVFSGWPVVACKSPTSLEAMIDMRQVSSAGYRGSVDRRPCADGVLLGWGLSTRSIYIWTVYQRI